MLLALNATAYGSPLLYDGADLLTSTEEESLLSYLDELSLQYGIDVAVVTSEDTMGYYDAETAATEYYENNYGLDGVLLLISMEYRDWYVLTAGDCITAIPDDELDYLSEQFVPQLGDGNYYGAFTAFAENAVWLLENDLYAEADAEYNILKHVVIGLVLGLIVALIVTGIMRAQLKSVKSQVHADEYTDRGSMNVTISHDTFLYRNVTKTRRSNNSSGSSGNHRSSSGRSYGGRGGKF